MQDLLKEGLEKLPEEEREEFDTKEFSSDENVGTSLGDLFMKLGF